MKRLAELADQLKRIWGFLALIVALGAWVGSLQSTIKANTAAAADLKQDLKELSNKVEGMEGRITRTVDRRLRAAHDAIEGRMRDNDNRLASLHDSVQRLVVLDEVRNGRPASTALPPAVAAGTTKAQQIHLAEQHLVDALNKSAKMLRPDAAPLAAF